jgi:hypothetical protein
MNDRTQFPSKIYLGNLQEKSRVSGDKFLTGSVCLDDIENVPNEHIQKGNNGKRYLKIIISPYKNGANEYGNTHSVAVDTFKPTRQNGNIKDVEEKEVDGNSAYDNEFFK